MGRCRFGRFSGAQSGSAVRTVGDLPESAPTTLIKNYLFESALASHARTPVRCHIAVVQNNFRLGKDRDLENRPIPSSMTAASTCHLHRLTPKQPVSGGTGILPVIKIGE
jgi:hypothetical protein